MRVDLRSRLKANTAITAIVGTAIDWNRRPEKGGVPALVLTKVSAGRTYTFDGATGLHGARVQFDCIAKDMSVATALFGAVRVEMERAVAVGATKFSMSFLAAERDMQTVDIEGVGPVGGISADFFVWFESI